MKNTIRDLWNGNIHPHDDFDKKLLPEIEMKRFLDGHSDFTKKLSIEDRKALFELVDSLENIWRTACEDAFESGFSLGLRLASESLEK